MKGRGCDGGNGGKALEISYFFVAEVDILSVN